MRPDRGPAGVGNTPPAEFSRTLLALTALVLLLGSGAATAAEPTPPPAEDSDNKTVVTPGIQQWSPPSAVIPKARLEEAGADLPSVLQEEAGLRVTRLGGLGAFSLLSVRGSTADQVLLFVDGIPLNSAEGGPVDLSTLPLGPIGSVAVYRGTAPVVFGSSAIGGVIDIRTRRLGDRHIELEAGGGSFLTRSARGYFGDGGGKASVGVSLDYSGTAGDFTYLSDNGTAFDPSDDREVTRANNRFDQFAGMFKAQLEPSEGVRLTALNLFTHSTRGLAGTGLYETHRSALARTRNLAGLRVETLRMPVQLAVTGYLAWSQTLYEDPLGEIGLGAADSVSQSWVSGLNLAMRVPVALEDDKDWTLTSLLSATYRMDRYEPRDRSALLRHVVSAAAELDLASHPLATHLVVSARYEGAFSVSEEVGPSASQRLSPDTHGASVRAAIVQDSLPDTRLMLSASRSLRLPSLYELYGDTGHVLGNPALVPETGTSLELSATHFATWLGDMDMLKFELAGFVTFSENLIQFVQNAQNVARPENVDSAFLAGVEAGISLDVVEHLRARTALTWLHTENTGAIAARAGKQLPFRPTLAVFGRLEGYHDLATSAVGEIGLRVELDYTAGNVLDHANLVQVPDRLLIGLGAHMQLWARQLRLDLAVRNVGSQRVQDLAGFPLPGVSAHVSLRWTATE